MVKGRKREVKTSYTVGVTLRGKYIFFFFRLKLLMVMLLWFMVMPLEPTLLNQNVTQNVFYLFIFHLICMSSFFKGAFYIKLFMLISNALPNAHLKVHF